jgi:hypothetical protein
MREGDIVEICCVRCFSTKTLCKVLACTGLDFLGVGNSSSDPSIWTNSIIFDDEAVKILTM